jgi:hypothetical protein
MSTKAERDAEDQYEHDMIVPAAMYHPETFTTTVISSKGKGKILSQLSLMKLLLKIPFSHPSPTARRK